jgi:hypothetical protein
MKTTPILLLLAALAAMAVEPNYVRTTIYSVGKDGSGSPANLQSTSYSDGLGRQIQSKLRISATEDRTACTFYDEAGRPDSSTKAFIDHSANAGLFLPGDLGTLNAAGGPLRDRYPADLNPFSYSKYSDDPLSRVIEQNGPGEDYTANPVKTWYFGVTGDDAGDGAGPCDADGFIKQAHLNPTGLNTTVPTYLNGVLASNLKYFLTVSKDPNEKYTQELKDLFGKTVRTWADPSIATNDEIIARYSYDILGNLTEETPPSVSLDPSTYTYNTLGQLIKKTSPDAATMGYAYTLTGQIEYDTAHTAQGVYRIRNYVYDKLDRLESISVLESGTYKVVQANYYDNTHDIQNHVALSNSEWNLSRLENLSGRLAGSICDIFNCHRRFNQFKCRSFSPIFPNFAEINLYKKSRFVIVAII